jgi:hypothetical protein
MIILYLAGGVMACVIYLFACGYLFARSQKNLNRNGERDGQNKD